MKRNMKKLIVNFMVIAALILAAAVYRDVVSAQTAPFTMGQLLRAISMPATDKKALFKKIISDVKTRRVDFPLTKENEVLLRNEGATNELIKAISENSPLLTQSSPSSPPVPVSTSTSAGRSTIASNTQQMTGTLTGTVTNPENKPINAMGPLLATGVFINLQEHGKSASYDPGDFRTRGVLGELENGRSRVSSNRKLDGLYTFTNLPAGVYDLVVEAGELPDDNRGIYIYYRPQRIVGIVVKPGQETVLNIVMHPGDSLQQAGNPKNTTLEMIGEPKATDNNQTIGWVEGTITNSDGQPVLSTQGLLASGVIITFKKSTGEAGVLQTDRFAGGFYSAFPLAGTYTVTVEKSRLQTVEQNIIQDNNYSPLIISGVTIKPGRRTILNIVLKKGDGLERRPAPQMETQPVTTGSK